MLAYLRTVAEIERKVKEESKRNVALRLLHAKSDKDKIAGWASDLNKILQIFNVRCVAPPLASLNIGFQTELAIDTNVAVSGTYNIVSGTHNIVSGTHNIVSDTHNVVSDTHNVVSDIRRIVAKQQEASDGQDPLVSNRDILFVTS
jgi:hypothetical protein